MEDLDNVCLVIGNTGCGKSTLLNALIHGSGALSEYYEDKVVKVGFGKNKTQKTIRKLAGMDKKNEFLKKNGI